MAGTRPPIRVLLFDLDGTVLDSISGITRSLAHTLDRFGLEVPDEATLARNVGPPLPVMLAEFGIRPDDLEDAVLTYRDRYRRLGEFECEPFAGIVDVLDAVRAAGVATATATSKGIEPTLRMLEHFGLSGYFDHVAAAAMNDVGHTKAGVIGEALAGLGHPDVSGSAMIGDRHYDIDGGRVHRLVMVGTAWGYGGRDELVAAGADHVVDTPADLGVLLGELATLRP